MNPLNPSMYLSSPEGLANAVKGQNQWISRMKEGGAWIVPRSMSVIRVYHSTKTAVFVLDNMVMEPDIVKVFTAMGWTCKNLNSPETSIQAFSC